jgi:FMN phosphatase YigB (HAD superfamily)
MNQNIENIIFDLGGVILNIDYNLTAQAFKDLGLTNFEEMYSQAAQTGLFDCFEKGLCSPSYFVNAILDYMPSGTSPNQVVAAWNAMILEFPTENLNLLLTLKEKYRIFLLSNTNEIHIQYFHRKLSQTVTEDTLVPFFEKVYYSSDVNLRKPDVEIFDKVCNDNQLDKSKTVFIDDTLQHIEGAKRAGLQTIHFQKGARNLTELFAEFQK